jgi:Fe-S oxidoreductase
MFRMDITLWKNEYPQMGGNYEVYHYTEILAKLVAEGKLNLKKLWRQGHLS